MGGNIPGVNFLGGNFPGGIRQGEFDGGEFSRWEFSWFRFYMLIISVDTYEILLSLSETYLGLCEESSMELFWMLDRVLNASL